MPTDPSSRTGGPADAPSVKNAPPLAHVAIAGAGIGGLTLAVALRRRGLKVTVLERAPELRPVGAGLTLQANAMKALEHLQLAQAAAAAGAVIKRASILDRRGRPIGPALDFEALGRELASLTVGIHRARLHQVLLEAAGADVVRLGAPVVRYEDAGPTVRVHDAGGGVIEADLLVGADGLHSAVRAQLLGDQRPVYAGYTSWRGVTAPGALPQPEGVVETWGRGERFGIVPVGFGEIYWFAVADAPAGQKDHDARGELLARLGGWHEPIAALIQATPPERILRTDIFDRPPVTRWHAGRVVLLGDAAHPMTPNLGQGACQAIEDAVVLDGCLGAEPSVAAALTAYEARRIPRANGIVRTARRLGALSQWRNPVAVWLRDTGMRLAPASVALEQARQVMTFGPG